MGSRKRSAWRKQKEAFQAELSQEGADPFAKADQLERQRSAQREEARRTKACTSKNRYATREEAQENLAWCEHQGRKGLSIYECPYCGGWHLTSHPWDD